MRRTRIVCTIGPASEDPSVLGAMIEAGMNVARLNLSHGTREEHRSRLAAVAGAARARGRSVGVLVDLKGPEVRLGTFSGGGVTLVEGEPFTLVGAEPGALEAGSARRAWVDYPGLAADVRPGVTLLLDDGNLVLEVESVDPPAVHCRVVVGGRLTDRKKVNVLGAKLSLPAVTDRDREDIGFAVEHKVDFIAGSFIRSADDLLALRRAVEEAGGDQHLIAKIESAEAVENLDAILRVADSLMVARGDLGVELPPEEVPLVQKRIIEKAVSHGKPVITATQMLESMVERPRPTRAEASDVANAIFDGTDAVMLSAETAVGRHPVQAVRVMARIAERTEEALDWAGLLQRRAGAAKQRITEAISYATCAAAHDLGAAAIITATTSGHTARMVARYRPRAPIVAATADPRVVGRLTLVWGVLPVLVPRREDTDAIVDAAVEAAMEAGAVKNGDLVAITAGVPAGVPGTTNLLKVQTVGDVLIRGVGVGQRPATARACVARNLKEAEARFQAGDILVTSATDREFMPLLRQAAGLIVEEGGLTSHAAIVALNLGLPAVVGAEGATARVPHGQTVTIDAARGLVYAGPARVL